MGFHQKYGEMGYFFNILPQGHFNLTSYLGLKHSQSLNCDTYKVIIELEGPGFEMSKQKCESLYPHFCSCAWASINWSQGIDLNFLRVLCHWLSHVKCYSVFFNENISYYHIFILNYFVSFVSDRASLMSSKKAQVSWENTNYLFSVSVVQSNWKLKVTEWDTSNYRINTDFPDCFIL